jgi:hypothetical protein
MKESDAKAMITESGWLGRCFGSRRSAPVNIACAVLCALLALGAIISFWPPADMKPTEFWAKTTPLITLIFGYLFGKRG